MPRHILTPHAPAPRHENLVKLLAQEISSGTDEVQPVILEERVPTTRSRHVHVIWDEWKSLTEEQRAAIIIDAYKRAEGEGAASEITVASGITVYEALGLGLLPYMVEAPVELPTKRRRGSVLGRPIQNKGRLMSEEYRKAFLGEARRTLLGADATELRYATDIDANRARERLEKELPGAGWWVVKVEDPYRRMI